MSVALSYDDNGQAGSPAHVFVHGWACDRSFFKPQYDHFGRSARAVALDLRGHGKSPAAPDDDYSIAAFASDVAALIDYLGFAPAIVVGHSLGGVIACALAAAHPDRVAAVVMVDPAPLVISDGLRPVFASLLDEFKGAGADAARGRLIDGMFMASDDPQRKAEIFATMSALPMEIALPAIAGVFDFDGPAALGAVRCPIATIGSDGPVNDAAAMKAINGNLLVGQTLASGHFNQLEVPDQVNSMIEQFLRVTLMA
jgi:pimeloyl-ACP methyl ester carboxylesterase